MTKRTYRFGMAYFGTRPLYIRPIRSEGVILGSRMVIKDTHQEWDVRVLWNQFVARKQETHEQGTEPTAESRKENQETHLSDVDGTGGSVAGGTAE